MRYFRRDGVHAVARHLQNLEQQNAELRHRLAIEARHRLDQAVERAIPNYREIDQDPNWHAWLRSVDSLSGRVRQTLLDEAIAGGTTHRVISFFRQFLIANQGAGQVRSWASSSGKPVYTRAQIQQLYEMHRKGAYADRDAEWQRQEADIIAASREGRIETPVYITK